MSNLHLVLFKSRNKDNQHLKNDKNKNYKQRTYQFLTHKSTNDPELKQMFNSFVEKGLLGEVSRFYYSVNARSEQKVQKALMHHMLDTDVDLTNVESLTAKLAAKVENRAENKWLFDCDFNDKNMFESFLKDVKSQSKDPKVVETVKETKNGYHVVVKHGFDTRKLLETYPDVSLKRDEFLYVDSKENHQQLTWVYEID